MISRICTLVFCAVFLLSCTPSLAQESGGVELVVWTKSLHGTIAGKPVQVTLQATGERITGSYCYEPCASRDQAILLNGTQQNGKIALTETIADKQGKQVASGLWNLVLQRDSGKGTWAAPNGKKNQPIVLTENKSDIHPFPYEIRVWASAEPGDGDDCSPPMISEIRLYKGNRLVQTLPTESQGTCGMFLPEIVDLDFDDYPDLMLAQFLPAGPNIPYSYWRYDPKSQKMVDVTEEMSDVTSPNFDPAHKIIAVFWRASCCSHGVTTYAWQGNHLVQVETAESYLQPEMINGKIAVCYIIPDYRDGRIEYPGAIYQKDKGLSTAPANPENCNDTSPGDFLERTYVQVWSDQPPPAKLKLIRTEEVKWRKTTGDGGKPLYCPDIPVFNNGKIERHLLKNPDQCSDTPVE